jgi:hypothetical protein
MIGQRAFLTTCTEFLKSKGLQWVTYIDSDEFVVLNRLGQDEQLDNQSHTSVLRNTLPDVQSNATILNVITKLKRQMQNFSTCYTMPRVLYGALENDTCPGAPTQRGLEKRGFQSHHKMSTLRFHLHADKGDFEKSRYGKVFMDVSNLPDYTIAKQPANIHRPFKSECQYPAVPFPESFFYINHYLGSWERYSSRDDGRRNKEEWEKRAFLATASSCEYRIFQWFERFVDMMGEKRAKYLLGESDDVFM